MPRRSLPPARLAAVAALGGLAAIGRPPHAGAQPRPAARAAASPAAPDTGARPRTLAPVRVVGRADDLVGRAATASQGYVGAVDLHARPIAREGELLETVPGLVATQHSGEGKANQYFVRGFNLDHGTDFQTRVEGMPVNLPTHGHGQGYTDLTFLVPELVAHLEYRLGVAHASVGDFGSAGGAELTLVDRLPRPITTAQGGAFGLARLAGGASRDALGGTLLGGGEVRRYDGPWERPGALRKASGMARWTRERGASRLSLLAMAYRGRWNANDQIPARAVSSGAITRWGQIDSTVGGASERLSLSGAWRRIDARGLREVQLYAIRSSLDLASNFTYFLDDPTRGDQFEQTDRRTVLGLNARRAIEARALGVAHTASVGVQARADLIGEVGLYRTARRARLDAVRRDRVTQTGTGAWLEVESRWRPWLRTVLGTRVDAHTFAVTSDRPENSGRRAAAIASPKASLVWTPSRLVEGYLSGGTGYHSNDARGTTIRVDPATGEAVPRVDPLVRSHGAEVGLRASPLPGLRTTIAYWALALDSELLFVGDAGGTEASAASRRAGLTITNHWRPHARLALDADVSLARARLRGVPAEAAYVPGALEDVVAGGIAWLPPAGRGALGALRVRHFGRYPLVESGAVRARPTTLLNADVGYRLANGLTVRALLLNLADARAADIQYWYASRLRGEPAGGVEDVHFHPAEPRQLRLALEWGF